MVLSVCAIACFALVFTEPFLLVYLRCPEFFKLKAHLTKWASFEVELRSPKAVRKVTRAKRGVTTKHQASHPARDRTSDH